MGNELLKIADGFSLVAEGLRGLASVEESSAVGTAEKDVAVTEDVASGDTVAAVTSNQTDSGNAQKSAKEDTADSKKGKAVTIEDVRAVMSQKTQNGKSQEVKELLQKYGAVKLSGVAPEHYPALLKEAGAL